MFDSGPATTQMIAVAKALVTPKLALKIKIKPLDKRLWLNRELVNAIFHGAVCLIDLKVLLSCEL